MARYKFYIVLYCIVLLESPYATSYQWTVLYYTLFRTVLKFLQIIGQISA